MFDPIYSSHPLFELLIRSQKLHYEDIVFENVRKTFKTMLVMLA